MNEREQRIQNVYNAYKNGLMEDSIKQQYLDAIRSGEYELPPGVIVMPGDQAPVPEGVYQAYKEGKMTRQDAQEFELDVKRGLWSLPEGEQIGTTPNLGFWGSIEEAFTGKDRTTEEVEKAGDWWDMPEMKEWPGAKVVLATMTTSIEETAKIIQANFPDVTVHQDSKGNYIFKSAKDNKEYAIKPGIRSSDFGRGIMTALTFLPAGKLGSVVGMTLGAAGTQAAHEGLQAVSGGEFNAEQIGIEAGATAALGGAGKLIGKGYEALKSTPAIRETANLADLAGTTKRAARGSDKALRRLAEAVPLDEETVAAAERLGVRDYMQVDHLTANQAYREVAQAIKSVPSSEARKLELEGFEQISRRADDLIEELGGTQDLSTLDATVKTRMERIQADLDKQVDDLFTEINESVDPKTPISADATLDWIYKKADDVGGLDHLGTTEKMLARELTKQGRQLERLPKEYKLVDISGAKEQELFGLADKVQRMRSADAALLSGDHQQLLVQKGKKIAGIASYSLDDSGKVLNLDQFASMEAGVEGKLLNELWLKYPSVEKILLVPSAVSKGFWKKMGAKITGRGTEMEIVRSTVDAPTYARLDELRKKIGDGLKNQGEFKDMNKGFAKKAYKLLLDDQRAALEKLGKSPLALFDAARSAVNMRKAMEDDLVALFGKRLDNTLIRSLATGTKRLSQGDVAGFRKMIEVIPEDMRQEVTASALNTAFGKSLRGGHLNFSTFADWFEKLKNNEAAYNILMMNLPKEARGKLQDLYKISKGVAQASRERITTGRLRVVSERMLAADSLLERIYNVFRKAAYVFSGRRGAGLAATVTSFLTPTKGDAIKAADELIISPEFIQLLKTGTEKASQKVTKTSVWKRYLQSIPKDRRPSNPERWLLASFQAYENLRPKEMKQMPVFYEENK